MDDWLKASCEVEASHNLVDWTASGFTANPIILTGGTATFTDDQADGYGYRFYRVRSGAVYSWNSLGYMTLGLPAGQSMIANQLNNPGGSTLAVLLPAPPLGTTVYKWNDVSQSYQVSTFEEDDYGQVRWTNPNLTLNPGEGCLIQLPQAWTATFTGDVPQGKLVNPLPVVLSIRSSMLPPDWIPGCGAGIPECEPGSDRSDEQPRAVR